MTVKVPVMKMKCPHCSHNLDGNVNAYLYGSPIRICPKCKKSYVDRRYHEVAIEGVKQSEVNPTKEDKKVNTKTGFFMIGIGIVAIVLFKLIMMIGWIVYPLPIFGVLMIYYGFSCFRENTAKSIEKKQKKMELERQQSELRLKNPEYVKQLVAIGYISTTYNAPVPQQIVCSNCRTVLDVTDKFCPTCGAKH